VTYEFTGGRAGTDLPACRTIVSSGTPERSEPNRAQDARTCAPSYCPQAGQARCGGFGSRQARLPHGSSVGAVVFHWERRERVLLRDFLRFGTATTTSPDSRSRRQPHRRRCHRTAWPERPSGGRSVRASGRPEARPTARHRWRTGRDSPPGTPG